jgi:transposase
MKLTKFSRSFWETTVEYGGADVTVLRDYDIIKAKMEGKSNTQIAIKHGISRMTVIRTVKKYM